MVYGTRHDPCDFSRRIMIIFLLVTLLITINGSAASPPPKVQNEDGKRSQEQIRPKSPSLRSSRSTKGSPSTKGKGSFLGRIARLLSCSVHRDEQFMEFEEMELKSPKRDPLVEKTRPQRTYESSIPGCKKGDSVPGISLKLHNPIPFHKRPTETLPSARMLPEPGPKFQRSQSASLTNSGPKLQRSPSASLSDSESLPYQRLSGSAGSSRHSFRFPLLGSQEYGTPENFPELWDTQHLIHTPR